MKKHYHVGQNTPGYLPEGDVYYAETKGEAIEILIDDKRRILDDDWDYELRCTGNARTDLGYMIYDTRNMYDLGLSLWAIECDLEECKEESEESA